MSELIGKKIDKPYQGIYTIKDYQHGFYYLVREKDGYDTWERGENFEKEYADYLTKLAQTETNSAPCQLFFKEKGIVGRYSEYIERNAGSIDFTTYESFVPSDKVDTANVWSRELKVLGNWTKLVNDKNRYKLELKTHTGYSFYHTFKQNEDGTWNIGQHPIVYTMDKVSELDRLLFMNKVREKFFEILFIGLNEATLWMAKEKFGDDKNVFAVSEIYYDTDWGNAEIQIEGGNVLYGSYKGVNGQTAKEPKVKTPTTKEEIIKYISLKLEPVFEYYINLQPK